MKEEPKFYAIDAAIEIAENPKYEDIIVTPARDLERKKVQGVTNCLLYTSPSPRDRG